MKINYIEKEEIFNHLKKLDFNQTSIRERYNCKLNNYKIPRNYALNLLYNCETLKEQKQILNILLPKLTKSHYDNSSLSNYVTHINNNQKDINPLEGLTRIYKDRVLISPIQTCSINCNWCFRERKDGKLNNKHLNKIYSYINNDKRIKDVIITGGEPLLLLNSYIKNILKNLRKIKHIDVIRFHTRALVTIPNRINDDFIRILSSNNKLGKPIYLINQIVHPLELSLSSKEKAYQLIRNGIFLYNQFPVLDGINDDQYTFNTLNLTTLKYHIKPYYAIATIIKSDMNKNYFVPIEKVSELVNKLSATYDGLARPTPIIPAMGEKLTFNQLFECMVYSNSHIRNTKIEI